MALSVDDVGRAGCGAEVLSSDHAPPRRGKDARREPLQGVTGVEQQARSRTPAVLGAKRLKVPRIAGAQSPVLRVPLADGTLVERRHVVRVNKGGGTITAANPQ